MPRVGVEYGLKIRRECKYTVLRKYLNMWASCVSGDVESVLSMKVKLYTVVELQCAQNKSNIDVKKVC